MDSGSFGAILIALVLINSFAILLFLWRVYQVEYRGGSLKDRTAKASLVVFSITLLATCAVIILAAGGAAAWVIVIGVLAIAACAYVYRRLFNPRNTAVGSDTWVVSPLDSGRRTSAWGADESDVWFIVAVLVIVAVWAIVSALL